MLDEVLTIPLQQEAQIPAIGSSDATVATDDMLVLAVLGGDEQAFAEIFERYKRTVTRVVGRFFRDRSEIEEFVQQSFTKTYFSLKSFRGGHGDSFPAWVTRIAVNVCYDEFRRRQRKAENLFTELSDGEIDFVETLKQDQGSSVERSLMATQIVDKILAGLDPRDRVAITLVYSEEHSLSDAARMIGISTSNLKSRLFRCRNHIKGKFGHLFR